MTLLCVESKVQFVAQNHATLKLTLYGLVNRLSHIQYTKCETSTGFHKQSVGRRVQRT